MSTIQSLDNTLKRLKSYTPRNTKVRREFRTYLLESMQKFVASLENDFDTVIALTSVFELITVINRDIDDVSLTTKEVNSVIEILKSWDMVMGVIDWTLLEDSDIPANIVALANERQESKKNKDYARADAIRIEVEEAGFTIVDTKDGCVIEKK